VDALRRARAVFTGPGSLARLCVAYVVAVTLVLVAIELPNRLHDLGSEATANAALSYADREIAGGNSVLADQLLAYEARAILPSGASYRVVIGPRLTKQASLPTASVPGWLRYFLMPRRPEDGASWVVCYGCDPATLGAPYEVLWSDDYGISVGRLG
jgi:hypothetical protein